MDKHWFDTLEGKLVVGEAALEERLQQAGPGDVVPLRELILADTLPAHVQTRGTPPVRPDPWTQDDYQAFGQWAVNLLQSEHEIPFTDRYLRRFTSLDLIPTSASFRKHFGTLANYQAAIGAPVGYERASYTDWTAQDCIDYVHKMYSSLPRSKKRPITMADIEQWHNQRLGPSYEIIHSKTGGLHVVNEHLGYPNYIVWVEQDYIDYGIDFIQVNGADIFTAHVFDLLGSRHRGPWAQTIKKRFKSWSNYKEQVLMTYEDYEMARQEQIESLRTAVDKGGLPAEFKTVPEDKLPMVAGRYAVAINCIKDMSEQQYIAIAVDGSDLIKAITRLRPDYPPADIETMAITLGVFDEIWPFDDHKKHLKISLEDLDQVRAKLRVSKRKTRNSDSLPE